MLAYPPLLKSLLTAHFSASFSCT